MIILQSPREYVKAVKQYFFPYINLYKQTRLNNVRHAGTNSEEFLSAVVINCLISEIDLLIERKLINTSGTKIKLQLTDAQAVVLYRALLALPLPSDQIYLQLIRNEWVQLLDMQLTENGLCTATPLAQTSTDDFGDYAEE